MCCSDKCIVYSGVGGTVDMTLEQYLTGCIVHCAVRCSSCVQYRMCAALCNSASLKFPQVRCAAPGLCMTFCGAKYYGGDSKARLRGGERECERGGRGLGR